MTTRRLSLKILLVCCLGVDACIVAAWALVDSAWFAQPFLRTQTNLLAGAFALDTLAVVALTAALARRRRALADDTEPKFKSLLDAAPDPLVIINGDGQISLVNTRAEQLFGHSRAELVGRSVDALLYQTEKAQELAGSLTALGSSKQAEGEGAADLRARRKDGTSVPVEISFSPLECKDGLFTISILRDITERRRLERLQNARHAVRRILAEATSLAAAAPRLFEAMAGTIGLDVCVLWVVGPSGDKVTRWQGDKVTKDSREPVTLTPGHLVTLSSVAGRAWATGQPAWATAEEL